MDFAESVISFANLTCHVEFSLWWMALQLRFPGELSMERYFPCQLTTNQTKKSSHALNGVVSKRPQVRAHEKCGPVGQLDFPVGQVTFHVHLH